MIESVHKRKNTENTDTSNVSSAEKRVKLRCIERKTEVVHDDSVTSHQECDRIEISDSEDTLNIDSIATTYQQIVDNILNFETTFDSSVPIYRRPWVNDLSLDALMDVIKKTTEFTDHLVHYSIFLETRKPCPDGVKIIQILGGNNHWRCLYYNKSKVHIYDSITRYPFSTREIMYLKRKFPKMKQSEYIYGKVEQQQGSSACGLFACVFATALALGKKFSDVRISHPDQPYYWELRRHLVSIIRDEKLSLFPDPIV